MIKRIRATNAVDIAAELVRHDLTIPLPTSVEQQFDLQFYGVIQRAYKRGVLPRFLTLMTKLKSSINWSFIRSYPEAQLWIVQHCVDGSNLPLSEAEGRIHTYLVVLRGLVKNVA